MSRFCVTIVLTQFLHLILMILSELDFVVLTFQIRKWKCQEVKLPGDTQEVSGKVGSLGPKSDTFHSTLTHCGNLFI